MKTDNRPWYWIPFLNFASALRYYYLGFGYYVQNLGDNEDIGYTRVYCTLLGDKTIMESIYRLVHTKESGFSDAISYT
jgi:PAT family beta-lactamase induction signal transducer AmpG